MKCARGEVHIWRIGLDVQACHLKTFEAMLSREEHKKASYVRTAQIRQRSVVARGALRCILAKYVRSKPSALVFRTEPFGKPYLNWPETNIPFNLSHTGGLALLAVTAEGRVGIDAEFVHPIAELEGITRHFFAAPEVDEIMALPPELRLNSFYACWTRKEAFVKALGNGLHAPIDQFRVTVRAEQSPRLLSLSGEESTKWNLADIGEANISATFAVDFPTPEIRRFNFAMTDN